MAKIYKLALAALLSLSFAAAQQTITLNNGNQFQGRFAGGTPDLITFIDSSGVRHRFDVHQIQSLVFNNPANYSSGGPSGPGTYNAEPSAYSNNGPPYANGYNQPPANYNQPPANYNQPPANYNPPPAGYVPPKAAASAPKGRVSPYATLPTNTQVSVRTAETIHTSGATPGRSYPASISQDVRDANGNVVIPIGSPAQLVVRDMGNNQLILDLQSVDVNGQHYALNTQDLTHAGNSNRGVGANRRTGEYVGGGAVLGTLLGAIAGGGRGAAIGALAGAAAGAGTQILTKGSEVQVPAETVLTFNLDQPVYLYQ